MSAATSGSDNVLETIDGALQDWETSGDAMRWTPEPPLSGVQKLRLADAEAQRQEVEQQLDRGIAAMRTSMLEWGESLGAAFATLNRHLQQNLRWRESTVELRRIGIASDHMEARSILSAHLREGVPPTDVVAHVVEHGMTPLDLVESLRRTVDELQVTRVGPFVPTDDKGYMEPTICVTATGPDGHDYVNEAVIGHAYSQLYPEVRELMWEQLESQLRHEIKERLTVACLPTLR